MVRWVFVLILMAIADFRLLTYKKSDSLIKPSATREWVISTLQEKLPGDTGALAAGILVGGNEGMSREAIKAFRFAGLSHIAAASGYNVTVVASWVELLLMRFLNKFVVIVIGILSIILYVFLAGGTAAVVRAGIMAGISMAGKLLGRESDGGWLLLITSLTMIIWQPGWLWEVGFQLSVAAMVGLIYFAGKSVLSQTLACQITTLPLILHYFGNLSVIAPIANLLFLWPVPVLMPVLAIGSALSFVSPAAGGLAFSLTKPLLVYMTEGVKFISSAHWASMNVDKMPWIWVTAYYLVLVVIKVKYMKGDKYGY